MGNSRRRQPHFQPRDLQASANAVASKHAPAPEHSDLCSLNFLEEETKTFLVLAVLGCAFNRSPETSCSPQAPPSLWGSPGQQPSRVLFLHRPEEDCLGSRQSLVLDPYPGPHSPQTGSQHLEPALDGLPLPAPPASSRQSQEEPDLEVVTG